MLRVPLVTLLLLLPLAAGCIMKDDPAEGELAAADAAGTADGAPETPPEAATPAAAGPQAQEEEDSSPEVAEPAEPVSVTTPVSWTGTLTAAACVPAGPGACISPAGNGHASTRLDHEGRATRVALQVAWTPASPLTESLDAFLVQAKSCGDGCTEGAIIERAQGPSPLALDLEAPELAEDEFLLLVVRFASPTSGTPVYAFAGTDQPVEATGEVLSLVEG